MKILDAWRWRRWCQTCHFGIGVCFGVVKYTIYRIHGNGIFTYMLVDFHGKWGRYTIHWAFGYMNYKSICGWLVRFVFLCVWTCRIWLYLGWLPSQYICMQFLVWPVYKDPSLPKAVPNMWFSNGTCSSAFLVLSSYIIIIYTHRVTELLIHLHVQYTFHFHHWRWD